MLQCLIIVIKMTTVDDILPCLQNFSEIFKKQTLVLSKMAKIAIRVKDSISATTAMNLKHERGRIGSIALIRHKMRSSRVARNMHKMYQHLQQNFESCRNNGLVSAKQFLLMYETLADFDKDALRSSFESCTKYINDHQ
jgi:hypothetical protein